MAVPRQKYIASPAGILGTTGTGDASTQLIWAMGVDSAAGNAPALILGSSVQLDIRIRAHKSDGAGTLTAIANFWRTATFRAGTATPVLVGHVSAPVPDSIDSALQGIIVWLDAAANGISLYVNGLAGTTIYWDVFATAYIVEGAA